MSKSNNIYVGLDMHQEFIAIALAYEGRGEPAYYGEPPNKPGGGPRTGQAFGQAGLGAAFCYEAGPCGYGLYRQLTELGQACEDMKAMELQARQRLGAFLPRHGRVYGGRSCWTQAHWRWLEGVKFDTPVQQIVLQEASPLAELPSIEAVIGKRARPLHASGEPDTDHDTIYLDTHTPSHTFEARTCCNASATVTIGIDP